MRLRKGDVVFPSYLREVLKIITDITKGSKSYKQIEIMNLTKVPTYRGAAELLCSIGITTNENEKIIYMPRGGLFGHAHISDRSKFIDDLYQLVNRQK